MAALISEISFFLSASSLISNYVCFRCIHKAAADVVIVHMYNMALAVKLNYRAIV